MPPPGGPPGGGGGLGNGMVPTPMGPMPAHLAMQMGMGGPGMGMGMGGPMGGLMGMPGLGMGMPGMGMGPMGMGPMGMEDMNPMMMGMDPVAMVSPSCTSIDFGQLKALFAPRCRGDIPVRHPRMWLA